jgi:hypothetical protein
MVVAKELGIVPGEKRDRPHAARVFLRDALRPPNEPAESENHEGSQGQELEEGKEVFHYPENALDPPALGILAPGNGSATKGTKSTKDGTREVSGPYV